MSLANQVYQSFVDEVPDLLSRAEKSITNLRDDHSVKTVHDLLTVVASIKNNASTVGLSTIQEIATKLEQYLRAFYDQDLVIDKNVEQATLDGFELLAIPLRNQIEKGSFDRELTLHRADSVWKKLDNYLGDSLTKIGNYEPSGEDLGIDIVTSIFENNVQTEIETLRSLQDSDDNAVIYQQTKDSLETLTGLSELLDLSGFSLLVNIAQQALKKNSDNPYKRASLLADDLEKSRSLILSGDRQTGGTPCTELLDLSEGDKLDDKPSDYSDITYQELLININEVIEQLEGNVDYISEEELESLLQLKVDIVKSLSRNTEILNLKSIAYGVAMKMVMKKEGLPQIAKSFIQELHDFRQELQKLIEPEDTERQVVVEDVQNFSLSEFESDEQELSSDVTDNMMSDINEEKVETQEEVQPFSLSEFEDNNEDELSTTDITDNLVAENEFPEEVQSFPLPSVETDDEEALSADITNNNVIVENEFPEEIQYFPQPSVETEQEEEELSTDITDNITEIAETIPEMTDNQQETESPEELPSLNPPPSVVESQVQDMTEVDKIPDDFEQKVTQEKEDIKPENVSKQSSQQPIFTNPLVLIGGGLVIFIILIFTFTQLGNNKSIDPNNNQIEKIGE